MAAAAWDATREISLKAASNNKGDVLYWMARDQLRRLTGLTESRRIAKETAQGARRLRARSHNNGAPPDFQLKGLAEITFERQGFALDLIEVADDAGAAVVPSRRSTR